MRSPLDRVVKSQASGGRGVTAKSIPRYERVRARRGDIMMSFGVLPSQYTGLEAQG